MAYLLLTLNILNLKPGIEIMQLQSPIMITSRLMPGVQIGKATISIGYSKRASEDGRTRYVAYIDIGRKSHEEHSLQSGCGGGGLQEGLESLLGFLGACGASIRYAEYSGREGENADLFPRWIGEWARNNSDELTMMEMELQETPDLIVE